MTRWWDENSFGRHVYIGQAFYKIDNDTDLKWNNPKEMPNQLRINRSYANISGSIFFRAKFLMKNVNYISDTLQYDFYKYPALIPTMSWKDTTPPKSPKNLRSIYTKKRIILRWDIPEKAEDGDSASYYVVYRFKKGENYDLSKTNCILSIQKDYMYYEKISPDESAAYTYAITAVDRLHNESEPVFLETEQ